MAGADGRGRSSVGSCLRPRVGPDHTLPAAPPYRRGLRLLFTRPIRALSSSIDLISAASSSRRSESPGWSRVRPSRIASRARRAFMASSSRPLIRVDLRGDDISVGEVVSERFVLGIAPDQVVDEDLPFVEGGAGLVQPADVAQDPSVEDARRGQLGEVTHVSGMVLDDLTERDAGIPDDSKGLDPFREHATARIRGCRFLELALDGVLCKSELLHASTSPNRCSESATMVRNLSIRTTGPDARAAPVGTARDRGNPAE